MCVCSHARRSTETPLVTGGSAKLLLGGRLSNRRLTGPRFPPPTGFTGVREPGPEHSRVQVPLPAAEGPCALRPQPVGGLGIQAVGEAALGGVWEGGSLQELFPRWEGSTDVVFGELRAWTAHVLRQRNHVLQTWPSL